MQFVNINQLQGSDGMIVSAGQEAVHHHECIVLARLYGQHQVFFENTSTLQHHSSNNNFNCGDVSDDLNLLQATAATAAPGKCEPPGLPPSPKHGYPFLVAHRSQQAAHEWYYPAINSIIISSPIT
jgi:hypothetical protein